MTLLEALFVLGCAALSVGAGAAFLSWHRPTDRPVVATPPRGLFFLFEGDRLQHASPEAEEMFKFGDTVSDWAALRAALLPRFPTLPETPNVPDGHSLKLNARGRDDHAVLLLEREGAQTRLGIRSPDVANLAYNHAIESLEAEVETLRLAATDAPYPIWLADTEGEILWCNSAYIALHAAAKPQTDAHEAEADPPLFNFDTADLDRKRTIRVPVPIAGTEATEWFNVTATPTGDETMYHAVDINAVIHAEIAQRNFVQTLAKTFAQLSIGLAIFDRNGQLALFNPALVDLTSLPAEFLSARPDLLSFFDRLRENRVMPEPKNYSTWRQDISDMITAATHGSYHETWSLDTGHTYRVSGRPHPDGAVAFLIEDITAEISLTRNFRAELELGQALMDTLEDGLVVFSSAGVLTFCNAAYRRMWALDPENSFADVTIVDCIKAWQDQCQPDPAWGDMRDYVMTLGERAAWDTPVRHHRHGDLVAHLAPIASGATVIRFAETQLEPLAVAEPAD